MHIILDDLQKSPRIGRVEVGRRAQITARLRKLTKLRKNYKTFPGNVYFLLSSILESYLSIPQIETYALETINDEDSGERHPSLEGHVCLEWTTPDALAHNRTHQCRDSMYADVMARIIRGSLDGVFFNNRIVNEVL